MEKVLRYISLCLLLISTLCAAAKREKNNIYLMDCTQSMQSKENNDLWNRAKQSLDRTLRFRAEDTPASIAIIPFQDQNHVYDVISFVSSDYDSIRPAIFASLDNAIKSLSNTSIIDALERSTKLIDPQKDNRIYLYTDGQDTYVHHEGVATYLDKWCGKYPHTQLFYIMLNEAAVGDSILEVAEYCDHIHAIKPLPDGNIPDFTDIEPTLVVSTHELDALHQLQYSAGQGRRLRAECDDRFFAVQPDIITGKDGAVNIKFGLRQDLSLEELAEQLKPYENYDGYYVFDLDITSAEKNYFVSNPHVKVYMANAPWHDISILDGDDSVDFRPERASWYDSFLWKGAKTPDTLTVDLKPQFNEAALSDGSMIRLRMTPKDKKPTSKLKAYYNSRLLDTDLEFTISAFDTGDGMLRIVFDPDAEEGEYEWELTPVGQYMLDSFNGKHLSKAADNLVELEAEYTVKANPLKVILCWISIVLLAGLLLWFVLLRRMVFPPIKVNTMVMAGSDGYYATARIKGAYMVRLTSSRRNGQGWISRIFKGKMVIVVDPRWTDTLTFVPQGKKLRFRTAGGWAIIPGSLMEKFNQYQLLSPDGKTKTDITLQ
ncbi:MAG: VWA domain-containing protein [Bacteroidales bacterium]|nr:VWA domain-containing protein [Bacteroidales bacterium]